MTQPVPKKKKKQPGTPRPVTGLGILRDILGLILTVGCTAGYVVFVLLIVSFFTLSVLHFTIEGMLLAGAVCGGLAGVFYLWKMYRKYHG